MTILISEWQTEQLHQYNLCNRAFPQVDKRNSAADFSENVKARIGLREGIVVSFHYISLCPCSVFVMNFSP